MCHAGGGVVDERTALACGCQLPPQDACLSVEVQFFFFEELLQSISLEVEFRFDDAAVLASLDGASFGALSEQ